MFPSPQFNSIAEAMTTLPFFPYSNLFIGRCVLCWLVVRLFRKIFGKNVYLVDFKTFVAPEEWKVTHEKFKRLYRDNYHFDQEEIDFASKLLDKSGIGDDSYFPRGMHVNPPQNTLPFAREEAEIVMFGVLNDLFSSNNLNPKDVDILIVNCSLFNPTPSLTSMIVNKYKMRENIQSYNLSGMGCSAGIIAVHLARDLLKVYRESVAVVVSTENITQNIYLGKERGMQISNTLFRVGGAAILLSNRRADRGRARYQLEHSVRTHVGSDDEAYRSVFQDIDAEGKTGVRLDRNIMDVASRALRKNITELGPLILPWSEQFKYALNMLQRIVGKWISKNVAKDPKRAYVPNFRAGIDYFCLHTGGRGVLDAMQDALQLSNNDVEPSRETLKRFGNTSSSSIWYELAYIEKNRKVRRGQTIWMIAFGSGFKCNSAVWRSI